MQVVILDSSRDYKHRNDLWSQDQAAWRVWDPPTTLQVAA